MKIKNHQGITLAELLVASYILLTGLCGILLLFVNCMASTQSAWDSTVAVSHAQYILEEMQNKNDLSQITTTNWEEWAVQQNLYTLPQERIEIVYPEPNVNPLDIQVNVQWQRKNAPNKITLTTTLLR